MGAGSSSSSAPPPPATVAVCDALERIVSSQGEYARELHDWAIAHMEKDAADATVNSSASAAARSKMAQARSQALNSAIKERLLADFLAPNARFHALMLQEIASGAPAPTAHPHNVVPVQAAAPASAAAAQSASAASASAASASAPPASPTAVGARAFAALSPAEREKAIRAGVEAQVKRVWEELDLQSHYQLMGKPLNFAEKEEAVQAELADTWNKLEF